MHKPTMKKNDHRNLFAIYLWPSRTQAVTLGIVLISGICLQVLNPLIMRHFIDTAVSKGPMRTLAVIAGCFLGLALISQALGIAETYIAERLAWTATNNIRTDLLAHCLGLD